MKCIQGGGFLLHQAIFLFAKCGWKSQNWDEGLDLARAMSQATIFCRDAHRSADQGAVMIDATASVRLQRWTGIILKFCDQPVDLLIGPIVEKIGSGQLWERGLHRDDVLNRPLLDMMAMIGREAVESLLEGLYVEEGDRKRADATAGAAGSAGNFPEQGGGCSLEPAVGFLIQRSRNGQSWNCHGRSFLFDGEIDDEMAFW